MNINEHIARELNLTVKQVENVLTLLAQGNTLAFIARYRKEMTQGVDERQVQSIMTLNATYQALENRRKYILSKIKQHGEIRTGDIQAVRQSDSLEQLEFIYAAYKVKKNRKVDKAREQGYEPVYQHLRKNLAKTTLQDLLQTITPIQTQASIKKHTEGLKSAKKGFSVAVEGELTQPLILENLKELWKEDICTQPDVKEHVQTVYDETVLIESRLIDEQLDTAKKYGYYYDFQEPLAKITSNRLYAILRGESEGVLKVTYRIDRATIQETILDTTGIELIRIEDAELRDLAETVVQESYTTRLQKIVSRMSKSKKRETSDREAVAIFAKNLEQRLLAAPLRSQTILALDPAYRSGCKIAIVNDCGTNLHVDTLYLLDTKKEKQARRELIRLLTEYAVTYIVLGNGTASYETEQVLKGVLGEHTKRSGQVIPYEIVDESGASVYSASEQGIKDFPNLSVEHRSAISLARRIQDPLAELVRIDPAALGLGQYQHMVDTDLLKAHLNFEVDKAVNLVGVDMNTASELLLAHVSGITPTLAANIVTHREQHGRFKKRTDLKKVKGIGPRIYEQSVGFMRIYDGENLLDKTGIHPQDYEKLYAIVKKIGYPTLEDFLTHEKVYLNDVANFCKMHTIEQGSDAYYLLEELATSIEDIRGERKVQVQAQKQLSDLTEGIRVAGTIRNITNFGAFVDIGIKQDGFLHISEISDTYIKNIFDHIRVGEQREFLIKNLSIEEGSKKGKEQVRIQLSLRFA